MANEPDMPQRTPYVLQIEPGTYAWCSCGKSQKQPYCDGAHGGTAFLPVIETVTETKTVAWCGCKRSEGPPFCDGSHARIPPSA